MKSINHAAIIMDGNGRWATIRGQTRSYGHAVGAKRAIDIAEAAGELGIKTLSLFAFSKENWRRPSEEVTLLMNLLAETISAQTHNFLRRRVRFRLIGDRTGLPPQVVDVIEAVEDATVEQTRFNLCVVANYSGQWDICQAIRKATLAHGVRNITPSDCEPYLSTAEVGDPDLILRTGGEGRLSNFYLWQAAYAELRFDEKLWPDFSDRDLAHHVDRFLKVERRFGQTSEQVRKQAR
jgi:undecaprenyl diphosphate synthase